MFRSMQPCLFSAKEWMLLSTGNVTWHNPSCDQRAEADEQYSGLDAAQQLSAFQSCCSWCGWTVFLIGRSSTAFCIPGLLLSSTQLSTGDAASLPEENSSLYGHEMYGLQVCSFILKECWVLCEILCHMSAEIIHDHVFSFPNKRTYLDVYVYACLSHVLSREECEVWIHVEWHLNFFQFVDHLKWNQKLSKQLMSTTDRVRIAQRSLFDITPTEITGWAPKLDAFRKKQQSLCKV